MLSISSSIVAFRHEKEGHGTRGQGGRKWGYRGHAKSSGEEREGAQERDRGRGEQGKGVKGNKGTTGSAGPVGEGYVVRDKRQTIFDPHFLLLLREAK